MKLPRDLSGEQFAHALARLGHQFRRVRQVRDDAPPDRGETRVAIANPSIQPLSVTRNGASSKT
jgi:hypothetical protein